MTCSGFRLFSPSGELAEEVFNHRLFEGRTDGRGRVRLVCDGLGNSTRDDPASHDGLGNSTRDNPASQKGAVSKGMVDLTSKICPRLHHSSCDGASR